MLSEALSCPRRGDDWPKTILIVGIFLAFYVQVAVYYLLGLGCARALREGRGADAIVD